MLFLRIRGNIEFYFIFCLFFFQPTSCCSASCSILTIIEREGGWGDGIFCPHLLPCLATRWQIKKLDHFLGTLAGFIFLFTYAFALPYSWAPHCVSSHPPFLCCACHSPFLSLDGTQLLNFFQPSPTSNTASFFLCVYCAQNRTDWVGYTHTHTSMGAN